MRVPKCALYPYTTLFRSSALKYVLGIDIGGTNLVVGAVTEDGTRVLGLRSEPTGAPDGPDVVIERDRKSTRLNSSHGYISYAVFCLKKKRRVATRSRDLG